MALHLVGLPWTELTREWEPEAYTARTRVLGTMLAERGQVYVYGGERHEMPGVEYVPIIDRAWQARRFPGASPSVTFDDYHSIGWTEFNVRAAEAIRERARPGDILGITMGVSQQLIVDLLADVELAVVEVGIGYRGIIGYHKVFESWAWRLFHSGRAEGMAEGRGEADHDRLSDARSFDAVIPRAYDVADFPAGTGDGGYFLFMGRLTGRKGAMIASQTCQRIGARLLVAGQGVASTAPGRIVGQDGTVLEGDVEHVGVVGPDERARLMGGAIATFVPTTYYSPFEGVHAESLLCGTPVITYDHGCFTEYVANGVNGYRCSRIADFVDATRDVAALERGAIRERAIGTYGTAALGAAWDAYLRKLMSIRREGWYELPPLRRAA